MVFVATIVRQSRNLAKYMSRAMRACKCVRSGAYDKKQTVTLFDQKSGLNMLDNSMGLEQAFYLIRQILKKT